MRNVAVVPALLVALLAGCSSTPMSPEQGGAQVEERNSARNVETPSVQTVTPSGPSDDGGLAALKDPNNPLSKRNVFFDFDSFSLKPEFKTLVETHARFLAGHPDMKMLIQGNADERGSREYNLALGQKRSEAVRNALTVLGAKDSQIESVSLGEEKPRCTESAENCWAQNRRADMLYTGEF